MSSARRLTIAGATVSAPPTWDELTQELAIGTPATLARRDGRGALQFSIAKYQGGKRPAATLKDLKSMVKAFAATSDFGEPLAEGSAEHTMMLAWADYASGTDLVRVWFVSNGWDYALITFLRDAAATEQAELDEAQAIVASISFDTFA